MSRPQDNSWIRNDIGRPMWWEAALLRPAHTNDGRGKFWEGEAKDRGYIHKPAQKIYALVTSDNRDEEFDIEAAWAKGSCRITFSADLNIKPQDRITFLDLPITTNEELVRGAGASDALVSHLGAVELLDVIGSDGTIYRPGFDYQPSYNADKSIAAIAWAGAEAPSADEAYGVSLKVRPRWIVANHAKIRGFGAGKQGQLPKRVNLVADDQRVRQ